MNIVEAYIKFNKRLIILISGLSGSNKTQLAQYIHEDFKITMVNIEKFCKKDFNKLVKVNNNVTINDWDDIESYDWDSINKIVDKHSSNGVIVVGQYLPQSKLKFTPDYHIHIKISKQDLINHRIKFIKENPTKCKELFQYINTPIFHTIINKITYPHYLEYLNDSKIDKFINAKDLTFYHIYDQATDYIFNKIGIFLNNYRKISNEMKSENIDDEELYLGTTYVDDNINL